MSNVVSRVDTGFVAAILLAVIVNLAFDAEGIVLPLNLSA